MYAKNRIGKSEASNELTITTDEAGTFSILPLFKSKTWVITSDFWHYEQTGMPLHTTNLGTIQSAVFDLSWLFGIEVHKGLLALVVRRSQWRPVGGAVCHVPSALDYMSDWEVGKSLLWDCGQVVEFPSKGGLSRFLSGSVWFQVKTFLLRQAFNTAAFYPDVTNVILLALVLYLWE